MDIEESINLGLFIEISSQLISFSIKGKSRLPILDLPFATLISGKMPTITSAPQSICLWKLLMIISTAQKVTSGLLGSYSFKCLQAILLGRLKQRPISKDKSKLYQSKLSFRPT